MKTQLQLLICLLPLAVGAQNIYTAATIPDTLRKNADAVFRKDEGILKVLSPSHFRYTVNQVITLLNDNAKDHLNFQHGVSKFRKIDDINMVLYGADGTQLKKFSRKDFRTEAYDDNISVLTDSKVMYLQTSPPGYPCTVEISYTEDVTSYIELPDWSLRSPDESVESSKFTVQVPAEIDIRYRMRGSLLPPPSMSEGKSYKEYFWQTGNLPAVKNEPGAMRDYEAFPEIEIAPNRFQYDGFAGDFKTWADFGAWNYPLYETTTLFSEERKAEINKMLEGTVSQKDKIARLYRYVQDNFRYVSIQLGIGGFKPFEVGFVDQKKYGDCKALTNYMRNLLKVAGIKSYPALVNAGRRLVEPADPSFPSDPFNHVILCAIADGDSTWVECTSSTDEPGQLSTFTENRNALLLTEKGGILVPTPASKASDNTIHCTTTIQLKEDGSGITESKFESSGQYRQDFINNITEEIRDEQKKYIVNNLGFLQPDDFELRFDKENKAGIAALKMAVEKIPEFTAGSKQFLSPRIYKIWSTTLPKPLDDKRKNDYYLNMPCIKTDTTIYQLPEGYGVDNLPKARDAKFEYGSFKTSYWFDEKRRAVFAAARLEVKQHRIPAAKYAAARLFFNSVVEEYTEKIVVKRL